MSGFWGALTGRTKPKKANLDSLFLVPSAAITLQTAAGLTPTGTGSVCFRAPEGAAYQQMQDDVLALLRDDADKPDVQVQRDDFGFTWLVEEQGFSTGLLCSLVPFHDTAGRKVGLVYLYKQGTFYPFAPNGPKTRDNLLEIQVRDTLAGELPMEEDLQRWLALWGAPGL
jgi:hypothetical protein